MEREREKERGREGKRGRWRKRDMLECSYFRDRRLIKHLGQNSDAVKASYRREKWRSRSMSISSNGNDGTNQEPTDSTLLGLALTTMTRLTQGIILVPGWLITSHVIT
eukprot:sb/3477498/